MIPTKRKMQGQKQQQNQILSYTDKHFVQFKLKRRLDINLVGDIAIGGSTYLAD